MSSGEGGRPVRSKLSRRNSVRRSASGAGRRPLSARVFCRKRSIGWEAFAFSGTGGRDRAWSDHQSSSRPVWRPAPSRPPASRRPDRSRPAGCRPPRRSAVCPFRHLQLGVGVGDKLDQRTGGAVPGRMLGPKESPAWSAYFGSSARQPPFCLSGP